MKNSMFNLQHHQVKSKIKNCDIKILACTLQKFFVVSLHSRFLNAVVVCTCFFAVFFLPQLMDDVWL
jgi:hypothetical protein